MSDTLVVTGGLGQLGSFVVEREASKGNFNNILILDDESSAKFYPNKSENVILEKIDISNTSETKEILQNYRVDAIVHTAAQISVPFSINEPLIDSKINTEGTLNLLDYAIDNNINRFISIGSASVVGHPEKLPIPQEIDYKPISPYGISKSTTEMYTTLFGKVHERNYNVVRPFNMYSRRMGYDDAYSGVINKFIAYTENDEPMRIEGGGDQTRDFVYTPDVAKLVSMVLESDFSGKIINAATGVPTSILELSKIIANLFEKDWRVRYHPPRNGDIKHSYGVQPSINMKFTDLKEGLKNLIKVKVEVRNQLQ